MKLHAGGFPRNIVLLGALFLVSLSNAQEDRLEPGRPIGKVTTQGNLIVMELDDGVLGKANLFDLVGRTLRFTPEGSRFRVESTALRWDSDFGPELSGAEVALHQFTFPFSGQKWNSFRVGRTGSIRFGSPSGDSPDAYGRNDGGVSIGRFDPLAGAAATLIDSAPAICVFFKPRMSGPHFVKELGDRVVITWQLTEPFGNIQDFTWGKTANRFQAVLHRDGVIELSYQELAAKDAIVGVYPALSSAEQLLATIRAEPNSGLPAHLDVKNLKLSVEDETRLKITFEERGPVLAEGNPALDGLVYRVSLDSQEPLAATVNDVNAKVVWTVRGIAWRNRPSHYVAFGPGVSRKVVAAGNTITFEGILPPALQGAGRVSVHAEVIAPKNSEPAKTISPHVVRLLGIRNPEIHFSSLTRKDGPFPVIYESFHYLSLPRPQDLSCTIIKALGDNFDFLAYYSDFRIDNQEAGTPSDGPKGGNVLGTGEDQHDLAAYCTEGRFQWGYVQPVYVGSNQMQERPPDDAPGGGDHDITFYEHQLGERSPESTMLPYNYAMSQLGHEMGHRWAAFVSAKVGGETIPLGPVHWARGCKRL